MVAVETGTGALNPMGSVRRGRGMWHGKRGHHRKEGVDDPPAEWWQRGSSSRLDAHALSSHAGWHARDLALGCEGSATSHRRHGGVDTARRAGPAAGNAVLGEGGSFDRGFAVSRSRVTCTACIDAVFLDA